MKCSLCDDVALWMVGRTGYCKKHKAEAYAAEAKKRNGFDRKSLNVERAYQSIDYLELGGGGSRKILSQEKLEKRRNKKVWAKGPR
jgi:hypothetical protein